MKRSVSTPHSTAGLMAAMPGDEGDGYGIVPHGSGDGSMVTSANSSIAAEVPKHMRRSVSTPQGDTAHGLLSSLEITPGSAGGPIRPRANSFGEIASPATGGGGAKPHPYKRGDATMRRSNMSLSSSLGDGPLGAYAGMGVPVGHHGYPSQPVTRLHVPTAMGMGGNDPMGGLGQQRSPRGDFNPFLTLEAMGAPSDHVMRHAGVDTQGMHFDMPSDYAPFARDMGAEYGHVAHVTLQLQAPPQAQPVQQGQPLMMRRFHAGSASQLMPTAEESMGVDEDSNSEDLPPLHSTSAYLSSRHLMDGKFVAATALLVDFLGTRPEDLVSKTIYDFVHPDDMRIVGEAHHKFVETRRTCDAEYRLAHGREGYIWVRSEISLSRGATREEPLMRLMTVPIEHKVDDTSIVGEVEAMLEKGSMPELAAIQALLGAVRRYRADNIELRMANTSLHGKMQDLQRKIHYKKTATAHLSCTECGTNMSPEWRRGPHGPKTLCNACGLRYAKKVKLPAGEVGGGSIPAAPASNSQRPSSLGASIGPPPVPLQSMHAQHAQSQRAPQAEPFPMPRGEPRERHVILPLDETMDNAF